VLEDVLVDVVVDVELEDVDDVEVADVVVEVDELVEVEVEVDELVEVEVEVDVDVEEEVDDVVVDHVNAASSSANESNSDILCVFGYYNSNRVICLSLLFY